MTHQTTMLIPTEPTGSIPRPAALIEGVQSFQAGGMSQRDLNALYDPALRETIKLFDGTGSPVISDGEQTKPIFATYPNHDQKIRSRVADTAMVAKLLRI